MVIYEFDYEISPLRAIYRHGVGAVDEKTAIEKFKANNPKAKIRSVKVRQEY